MFTAETQRSQRFYMVMLYVSTSRITHHVSRIHGLGLALDCATATLDVADED
jgi:hypothetical protein